MAIKMHSSAILTGLKTTIGTTGGVVAHWEAYPLPWPTKAQLPCICYRFADFVPQPSGGSWEQGYQIDCFLVMQYDGEAYSAEYGRIKAEAIHDIIMADRSLGLGAGYEAMVRRVTSENELQIFFREENQPRQAFLIEVIVQKYETGT